MNIPTTSRGASPQIPNAAAPRPEPMDIWYALAAPGEVRPCASIVLASAREHDDVDLLRRMVQRHGGEIVYRRFAGADPDQFESGAAYADFASAERLQRANARALPALPAQRTGAA